MVFNLSPGEVANLPVREQEMLDELMEVFLLYHGKNAEKNRYYEGNISLREVNLGIALPKEFQGLELGCAWGAKTVDVLASRSMFDGYVGSNGDEVDELDKIVEKVEGMA